MHRTAVMPTAKTLFEPETPPGSPSRQQEQESQLQQQQQQKEEEGLHSPCTPPLQSIGLHTGQSLDKPAEGHTDILNWSPQTPESLPVTSIHEVVAAAIPPLPQASSHTESPGALLEKVVVVDVSEQLARADDSSSSSAALPATHAAAAPAPSLSSSSSPSASVHVDPHVDCGSSAALPPSESVGAPAAATAAVSPSTAVDRGDGVEQDTLFFPVGADSRAITRLATLICAFSALPTLVQLMRVSHASHRLATSDAVWKAILSDLNLPPLLSAFDRRTDFYTFFLHEVVTTHALHGHYTFQAANNLSGSHGSVSNTSGSRTGGGGTHHRDDDSLQDDVFNIASLQLLISAASLGQSNHRIGRVQLLLTYKNDSMEVLQGSCRFSIFRRCFSLCCSAFGTVKRGPVFTVAVATVTKPWANEGFEHFSEHKNGIRLVMTPVLWEGQSPGSQITEKDILVVSRPRPDGATAPSNASLTETTMQPCG